MIKRNKIPTILGVILLLAGTFAGVFLLRTNQIFRIGASATTTPKDIRVSNLSNSTATISWVTEDQTTTFITYGTTQNVGTVIKESENDQKYFTHSITITGLSAETNYFYKINTNGTSFDNNGVPWQFTTGPEISGNSKTIPVSGSVIDASGQPSRRAIVYITINGYLISTITSDSGSYVLQLSSTRTSDLSKYADINISQTLLDVSVEAEGGEMASAKIFPQSANPIPTLVIGQTQDYRNLQPTINGQNPDANLDLPESSTSASKFNVSGSTATPSSKTVILENIDEGETVTSTQPEFFGKGPSGGEITITVHSQEVITDTVKIPGSGSWNWAPPTNLEEGAHTVTISWIDTSGITRTLTRNFIVQAGELPSYSASLSGKTSTPTPTASPKVTATPTATPKITLTPTPVKTSRVASQSSIPVTGDLTPTLLLFMMGIAVVVFSIFTWKFSKT
jgi:hypothetical protein